MNSALSNLITSIAVMTVFNDVDRMLRAFIGPKLEKSLGRGSYSDNLFIERLWRTAKYEEVYLKAYQDGKEARAGIGEYFRFYDTARPHQALGYRTPAEVYGNPVESLSGGMVESLIPIITRTAGPALNRALILSK